MTTAVMIDGSYPLKIISMAKPKTTTDCGHGGRAVLRAVARPRLGTPLPEPHDAITDVPRGLSILAAHDGNVDTGSPPAANEDRGNKTKSR